jgi:hypothetical protein
MNNNYLIFGIILSLLVILAGYAHLIRSKKIRAYFCQSLTHSEESYRWFLTTVISSIILILTSLFVLFGINAHFTAKKEGIAIVVDNSEQQTLDILSLKKQVGESLLRYLSDIPISLYEYQGETVFSLCPPTIDKIFFNLQLQTLRPSTVPHTISIPLYQIEKEILNQYASVHPWVIFITTSLPEASNDFPKGAAVIVVSKEECSYILKEGTLSTQLPSLSILSKEIRYRLAQSEKTSTLDTTTIHIISLGLILTYLLFLFWRKQEPSWKHLTIVFLLSHCSVGASDENSSNSIVQSAIELSNQEQYIEALNRIEGLINSTTSSEARARLMYNQALLQYLNGDDQEAISSLSAIEPDHINAELQKRISTVECLSLIHLLKQSSTADESKKRTLDLQQFLGKSPGINPDLLNTAKLALKTPLLQIDESILFTIHWLQNAALTSLDKNDKTYFRCAEGISTITNGKVQDYLKKFFDEQTLSQFIQEASSIKTVVDLNRLFLWYYLSAAHTVDETIDYLFEMGCTISNRGLYFSDFKPIAEHNLPMLEELLKKIGYSLPENEQVIFNHLIIKPSSSYELKAIYWYIYNLLWPVVLMEEKARYKELSTILCEQQSVNLPYLTQKTLAEVTLRVLSLSNIPSQCKDPLEYAIDEIFKAWYNITPIEFFQFLIAKQKGQEELWTPHLIEFLSYSMQKDKEYSNICTQIVRKISQENIESFNIHLLTYLWQIGLCSHKMGENPSLILSELEEFFLELHASMNNPSEETLKTFCLTYAIMPDIEKNLQAFDLRLGEKKQSRYKELLFDFMQTNAEIQKSLQEVSQFRLPKVKLQILKTAGIILQMQHLISETSKTFDGINMSTPPQKYPASTLSQESAIRLYQELDVSDRKLLGE